MKKSQSTIANRQIDDERVRVTEYRFSQGSETKWHKHEWDYVVIPQTDGELLLVDAEGKETKAKLNQGIPYYREAGVEHNVINAGSEQFVFIEVEMKAHTVDD